MKRKKIFCISLLPVVLIMALSGCGGSKATASAESSGAPESVVAGYYSLDQSITGGSDLNNINLRDIEVTKQTADTVITFTFKDGSLQMGMQEEEAKGVPKYGTQFFGGLNRLVLNISGLIYWDYTVWEEELADTPILGIFKQTPVNKQTLTKLYINLQDNVAYRIEEKDNKLLLYLRAMPEKENSKYYVLLNAFEEYTEGKIPDDEGLSPTLCVDKTNVTMISSPFATQAEANGFRDKINTTLVPNLPGTIATVVQLKNNQLPVYDESGALNAYISTTVTRSNGAESVADPLISNGKILCWKPGEMAYVFVTPFFLGGENGGATTSYQKIYMSDIESTTPKLLSQFEYSDIQKAEFSDDGRYLAFLEQGDTSRTLYVYDTQSSSNQVITAAEHGFGVDTADFAWGSGDTANTIYAITGESDMLQLMSYTIKDNQESNAQTLVEDAFTEGDLNCFDGKVYYSQSSTDQSGVYCFDPVTKAKTRVCDGYYFEMNRRTGLLAVQMPVDDNNSNLYLFNLRTKTQKSILKNQPIGQCVWSRDGTGLYYTVYKSNVDKNDRFKLTLNLYSTLTGKSSGLKDIVEGNLNPSDKNSEVLLTCLYPQNNQYVAITYRIPTAG